MTAGEALQALMTLQKLANAPFPATDAFVIGKLIARLQLNPDIIAADAARLALSRKFSAPGSLAVPPEKLQAFAEAYAPVAALALDLDLTPLPASVLTHAPSMTPVEMMALVPFLEK